MLTINLKSRFKNKAFLLSMVGAIVLLIQQLGFNIIPDNYSEIVNTILTILTMLGIVVDTSTIGVSDKIIETTTENVVQAENTVNEVKTEGSSVSINDTVSEKSQSGSADASASSSDKESETNSNMDTSSNIQVSTDNLATLQVKDETLKAALETITSALTQITTV